MKTYAIAGTGVRARYMFAKPIVQDWRETSALVGLYDANRIRAERLAEECGGIPVYDSFAEMLADSKPDVVIVATTDSTHHLYIIDALLAGCDVISEKPMTIDGEKCRAILEAERASGRKVIVTFNARYNPYVTRIKELLTEGAIGEPTHVLFEWNLDTSHGADYYRRWHRRMENSGGLLVHKSTHHFDMVNWWLGQDPLEVYAYGDRLFYGATREERGERCQGCAHAVGCEFYLDLSADPVLRAYYLEAEHRDGYIRDGCVFDESITIYDTMSLNVRYEGRKTMNYSLVSYSPFEGWRAVFHGTKGRMTAEVFTSGPRSDEPEQTIELHLHSGETLVERVPKRSGGHGGSDLLLQRRLFGPAMPDPLGHEADSMAGALSLCVGAAANRSIAEGRPIRIRELLEGGGESE
ncbi:Gfo/Idh/MocA family protein [Paenibacillus koleovorans]|uniref:Gfo/Idh/MocA family protein n=1 Tax=Paenibacillus koleovorans TaxID=121608 RepID=UPI000FDA8027|nr:Gfo/Idh/MocA family oxidoreductase [Paenibacillus koleovorans]